ncbi:MAG: L(+)-tartrate dehydratase subunit alpha [Candidatus Heimdallarchaeota archaeon LC_2]|nr:MAG: L(+)-tartrate dehydratase subunit alpha [Candidatus Heimdallarchaeota archaeon LC_2]
MIETVNLNQIIEDTAVALLRTSATRLPFDVELAMQKIKDDNISESTLLQMTNILDNVKIAREQSKPMCQDTGIIAFKIEVGDDFPIKSNLKEIFKAATRRATKEIPLRPNTVDFFEGNPGDNIDIRGHIPYFYIDLVPGNELKILATTKGGGSSNIAQLGMLKPGLGMEGALKFAIDVIADAGPQGCPPYRVGIGIGGGEDICMTLAKKAIFKPIGERHQDPRVAKLEESVMEAANLLPIGPMGVGDGKTVIDVNIELASRHPASLPVGVVMSCWALRYGSAKINSDGNVTFLEN